MTRYYVYTTTNKSRTLQTVVTSDLKRRVCEHKHKVVPGFTARYNITRLAQFGETPDVRAAPAREQQIKGWLRARKSLWYSLSTRTGRN
jgi:putative endonuclease